MLRVQIRKNFLPLLTDLEMTCLTALTQHVKQRDSEAPSLRRLTTILPLSGCLLRLSARSHFTSEGRWRRRQLKRGRSQRLERPWKKGMSYSNGDKAYQLRNALQAHLSI